MPQLPKSGLRRMASNPYFSMLLASPCEVFSKWKWQAGDRGILLGDGREVMVVSTRLEILKKKLTDLAYIFPYSDDVSCELALPSEIIPVPTIAQLQEMAGCGWRAFDEMCAYEYGRLRSRDLEKKTTISKEMAGFAIIMQTKYKLDWDDSTWQRIEDDGGESDV